MLNVKSSTICECAVYLACETESPQICLETSDKRRKNRGAVLWDHTWRLWTGRQQTPPGHVDEQWHVLIGTFSSGSLGYPMRWSEKLVDFARHTGLSAETHEPINDTFQKKRVLGDIKVTHQRLSPPLSCFFSFFLCGSPQKKVQLKHIHILFLGHGILSHF